VDHDEGSAWCQRVAGEIEWAPVNPVICGDGRLIRVGSHHVEREFSIVSEVGEPCVDVAIGHDEGRLSAVRE
jgi:hypothetical protein